MDYEWQAEIDGAADGTISYRMRGQALTAFSYAKIGICVHHPITGYAGQPYCGSTPDGPVTGNLPDAIGPQIHLDDGTDLPLFEPVSDLDIAHVSGGVVRFDFSGDLWEMEDQRNWTDASYKSASTPAKPRLPPRGHRRPGVRPERRDPRLGLSRAWLANGPGRLLADHGVADARGRRRWRSAASAFPRSGCAAPTRAGRRRQPGSPCCARSARLTCGRTCDWRAPMRPL